MALDLYQVDAFTDRAFGGNPAAVCLLPAPAPAAWMQAVANEMNLSETAFVHRVPGEGGRWGRRKANLRPALVHPGHRGGAVRPRHLASAHVLWEAGWLGPDERARFQTLSGLLTAQRQDGGERIELDFPAKRLEPAREIPDDLLGALGAPEGGAAFVGKSAFDYLVEVGSEREVRGAAPDLAASRSCRCAG